MTMRLLVVDDEPDIAEVIAFGARMVWPDCEVITAQSGQDGLRQFLHSEPDLVILDVGLPPPDGFELCRLLRARSSVPIIMLTARGATADKVRALELGADDYLTKPFDHVELFARLRALLRRVVRVEPDPGSGSDHQMRFMLNDLRVDLANREITGPDGRTLLTATEARLLEELFRHAGTVVPHARLLERVWGDAYRDQIHYLKVFIGRLRRKLGDDAEHPRYIETRWGIGYRLVIPPAVEQVRDTGVTSDDPARPVP